jgi:hypothetical protein
MSQENVELVLAFVDAYNRAEFDAVFELCTPDVEGYPDASVFPEPRPRIGQAEVPLRGRSRGQCGGTSPSLGGYNHRAAVPVLDRFSQRAITTAARGHPFAPPARPVDPGVDPKAGRWATSRLASAC